MNHLREWYGIHFPEFDKLLDKHETYARLVKDLGNKDDFTSEKLQKEGIPSLKARQIVKAAENSMGADLTKADLIQIQNLSKSLLKLYNLRQNLEKYLEITMEKVGINIKTLTGSLLGARLIALAGGITKLAKMPASTLQVLGAEKALFRSLKTGSSPPKHGIIFQHPLLHEAKRWQRGKVARALAGKLTIAARADAFGGRYIGDELKTSLDNRIEEIREKYSQPSKKQTVQSKKPRKSRKQKKRKKKKYARKN
jgi:nucleolar protein 56